MAKNDGKRLIELGSCTWCGHKPHGANPCNISTKTGSKESDAWTPCRCAKRIS